MDKMLSFIVPFYSVTPEILSRCLNSILSQGIARYEIILVDDGCESAKVRGFCKDVARKNKNVKYYRQKNAGAAVARNAGIERAKGDIIVFVDADDQIADGFFDKAEKELASDDIDIWFFDYSTNSQGNVEHITLHENFNFTEDKDDILANIMFYPGKMEDLMFGAIWAKCYSRTFIEGNKIRFQKELRKAQDRRFMLEAVYLAKKAKYSPIEMYQYKLNAWSITHKINWDMEKYYLALVTSMDEFCKNNGISKELSKFVPYNAFYEMIRLTVCHPDNGKAYKKSESLFGKMYNEFGIGQASRAIRYGDIPTVKGKVKLFALRRNWYFLTNQLVRRMQRNENKQAFQEETGC